MKNGLKSPLLVIAITLSLSTTFFSFQRVELGDFDLQLSAKKVTVQRSLNFGAEKRPGAP
jgi:hypothetical protein